MRSPSVVVAVCLIALFGLGAGQTSPAANLTAFQLIREGNRYVSEEAKDKVVQIRSEKSVGDVTPAIW